MSFAMSFLAIKWGGRLGVTTQTLKLCRFFISDVTVSFGFVQTPHAHRGHVQK